MSRDRQATIDPNPQVLVVGAGPTGLLLAAELVRRGVSCLQIDAPVPAAAGTRQPSSTNGRWRSSKRSESRSGS